MKTNELQKGARKPNRSARLTRNPLKSLWERFFPVGYQDDNGFHFDPSKDASAKKASPQSPPPA
jgi:hypothetical protein